MVGLLEDIFNLSMTQKAITYDDRRLTLIDFFNAFLTQNLLFNKELIPKVAD